MDVDVIDIDQAFEKTVVLANRNRGAYVCVSNVHMCMEVFDSPDFGRVVNGADLVLPDGRPLSWAQKLLGHAHATQVRGQDIMNALCSVSGQKGLKIGFYGGRSDSLLFAMRSNLMEYYSDIQIAYAFAPPFRPLSKAEDRDVVARINSAGVNVLFVGIGCPKQERWMFEHRDSLNCVMLGVGAAFDFIAGDKKHAPRWIQRLGLEWIFRLCCEPTRLWKRYLRQNPRFIYNFGLQLLKIKLSGNKVN